MQSDFLASLRSLSDAELVARVHALAAGEREATVLLVAHLAELDTRDVHFRAGHGSLFAYCRDVLALSEQEAYNRIAVGRAARRFPVILELLESAAVSLTTVRLLAPHLTPANHRSVLESARGKTKVQVEEIAAALWPRPDVPSLVRKLPAAKPTASPPPGSVAAPAGSPASPPLSCDRSLQDPSVGDAPGSPDSPVSPGSPALSASSRPAGVDGSACRLPSDPVPAAAAEPPVGSRHEAGAMAPLLPALPAAPARRSAEVTPLSPDRYKVQVTIGGDTLEKLRLAKDLLRHAVPSGDEAVILDRALTALLLDLAQSKFAAADKPRPSGGSAPGSRHVPAEVRRTVWLRDLGRCAFVGTNGRRCPERAFLEFHHVTPYALGGEATVANIQLRCRSHNAYEARLYFGNSHGNGGAGSVREETARYGPAAAERSSGRAASRTRSRTSSRSGAVRGPAP